MADAPPRIEKFRLIAKREEEFDVLRTPVERAFTDGSSAGLLGNALTLAPPPMNDPAAEHGERGFPRFDWNLTPQFRQSFFDPHNPLAVQLVADVEGDLELLRGLVLTGVVEGNIFNNYPTCPATACCRMSAPMRRLYVHEGGNGIGDLMADYKFRLAPDVFAQAKVG